jgi:hypothetical protein
VGERLPDQSEYRSESIRHSLAEDVQHGIAGGPDIEKTKLAGVAKVVLPVGQAIT